MFFSVCRSFFFFKQKTAYEMRISDWSSDVCSSVYSPVDLLCDPIEGDLTAAIALSLQAAQSTLLHDIGRESESLRLQQLSEEVSRIARTLANLSSQDDSPALPLSASASRAETHGGYAVEPVHVSDTPASPVTAREIRDMQIGRANV